MKVINIDRPDKKLIKSKEIYVNLNIDILHGYATYCTHYALRNLVLLLLLRWLTVTHHYISVCNVGVISIT